METLVSTNKRIIQYTQEEEFEQISNRYKKRSTENVQPNVIYVYIIEYNYHNTLSIIN